MRSSSVSTLCDATGEQIAGCPHCGLEETTEHLWWDCHAYAHLRYGLRDVAGLRVTAPRSVWRHGLQPFGGRYPIGAIQNMMVKIFEARFAKEPAMVDPGRSDAHLFQAPRPLSWR